MEVYKQNQPPHRGPSLLAKNFERMSKICYYLERRAASSCSSSSRVLLFLREKRMLRKSFMSTCKVGNVSDWVRGKHWVVTTYALHRLLQELLWAMDAVSMILSVCTKGKH